MNKKQFCTLILEHKIPTEHIEIKLQILWNAGNFYEHFEPEYFLQWVQCTCKINEAPAYTPEAPRGSIRRQTD
jgi:hypothetical protein